MKKIILAGIVCIAATGLFAQEGEKKAEKKEVQEIIIKKSGDGKDKITVVVDGDNVTVNGKPLSEFKDDDVKVIKRKSIMRNGNNLTYFGETIPGQAWGFGGSGEPKAYLGINGGGDNEGSEDSKPDKIVKISNVFDGSPAEKAGLKEGDIITKIDDKKIENFNDVVEVINGHKPKDEVTITYTRDGKEKTTKATLGERKADMSFSFSGPGARSFSMPGVPFAQTMPPMHEFDFNGDLFGDHDLTGQMKKLDELKVNLHGFGRPKLGLKIQDTEDEKGVKVLDVNEGSPAEKAGLKKDDVITEIGGKKVNNTDEAMDQLHENAEKASYSIKAKRNGSDMNFDIKIPKKLKTANL